MMARDDLVSLLCAVLAVIAVVVVTAWNLHDAGPAPQHVDVIVVVPPSGTTGPIPGAASVVAAVAPAASAVAAVATSAPESSVAASSTAP